MRQTDRSERERLKHERVRVSECVYNLLFILNNTILSNLYELPAALLHENPPCKSLSFTFLKAKMGEHTLRFNLNSNWSNCTFPSRSRQTENYQTKWLYVPITAVGRKEKKRRKKTMAFISNVKKKHNAATSHLNVHSLFRKTKKSDHKHTFSRAKDMHSTPLFN